MTEPLISVIIVNHNGKEWLKACLGSVFSQDYPSFEVILIDNASDDESVSFTQAHFPKVKIISEKTNHGFAQGNNIGFAHAKGEYIFLLNNDTVVEKNCLTKLKQAFVEIPKLGIVQPKIILLDEPELLDQVGSYWTNTTYLYHFGFRKPHHLAIYNHSRQVFSSMGAAIMISREVIEKVGLFDARFWCYYEETDFCHRAWMLGYESWYYPHTVVLHSKGATSTSFRRSFVIFHSYKNKLRSFIKNFEVKNLIPILPTFFLLSLSLESYLLLTTGSWQTFRGFWSSLFWNVANIRETLAERKIIQTTRRVSDKEILSKVTKNPRFSYYNLAIGPAKYQD